MKELILLFMLLPQLQDHLQQTIPDSIRTILSKEKNDTSKILRSCKIAYEVLYSDPELSLNLANMALEKSREMNYRKGLATSMTQLGAILQMKGDYKMSESYNRQALEIRLELKDLKGAAINYNNLGILAHNINNYPLALEYYRKSLSMNRLTGNLSGEATALYCIGTVHENQSAYDSALTYYFSAQSISEKIPDQKLIGYGKLSLANVYFMMENFGTAKSYYRQAINIYEGMKNYLALLKAWMSLGQAAEKTDSTIMAVDYYQKALKYGIIVESPSDQANIRLALGSLYENLGMTDSARVNFIKARGIFRELDSKHNLALALVSIARIMNDKGDFKNAEKNLHEAETLTSEIESPSASSALYLELSQTNAGLRNFEKAYQYIKKYTVLKDSLMTSEKQKQILDLQTRYETDKKEKENVILRQERKILTTTRNSLTAGAVLLIIIALVITRSLIIKRKDNKLLSQQKKEITGQKEILEIQKKEITDSIHYARRIQTAMLPTDEIFRTCFPHSFILYLPKDIVSGDFYWVKRIDENKTLICVADCTGHGVPGAFMSMLGMSLLNEIAGNYAMDGNDLSPAVLLDLLRDRIKLSLRQTGQEGETRDGMDMSVCIIDKASKLVHYSGANNPVYIVNDNELTELKATRNPIGIYLNEKKFTNETMGYKTGSMIYMFSDGFSDQIGETGSKFLSKNFRNLLQEISHNEPDKIKQIIHEKHLTWKGCEEQVDDILVAGIRI